MQIANMATLIAVGRIGYGRRFNENSGHLVGIVMGEPHRNDISFVLNCLQRGLCINRSIVQRIELH